MPPTMRRGRIRGGACAGHPVPAAGVVGERSRMDPPSTSQGARERKGADEVVRSRIAPATPPTAAQGPSWTRRSRWPEISLRNPTALAV